MKNKNKSDDIVKENILRVLLEETYGTEYIKRVRELAKHAIIPDAFNTNLDEYFMESLKELQVSGLVEINEDEVTITKKGREKAENIFSKHKIIERFFLKDFDETESHKLADILEHSISKEVLENMTHINSLVGYGVPLNEIVSKEGIITDFRIEDTQLVERLISMGLCPGQKIKIIARLAPGIILKIKNTQVAVDKDICNGIMVAMN
ncbi:MAG: metal-dependent transcriptional regulator [Candidatus Odinarchaeota archaeon]